MAHYSLPQIANFLTAEKTALHGISPEVYAQNTAIVQELGALATTAGEEVLAVQLFGSRAAGYSNLDSDIDINVVAADASARKSTEQLIKGRMAERWPTLVIDDIACITARIDNPVPDTPDAFVEWVMTDWGPHSIFGDGLVFSVSLLLTRLAALEVMNARTNQNRGKDMYDQIRSDHAETFLGNPTYMREKLAERLGKPITDVAATIQSVYQRRQEVFGMPIQCAAYHEQLSAWAAHNRDDLKHLPAYHLYRAIAA